MSPFGKALVGAGAFVGLVYLLTRSKPKVGDVVILPLPSVFSESSDRLERALRAVASPGAKVLVRLIDADTSGEVTGTVIGVLQSDGSVLGRNDITGEPVSFPSVAIEGKYSPV